MDALAWQDKAACTHIELDRFFPSSGNSMPKEIIDTCGSCPCRAECLEHALKYENHGYWGGTNERERRRLRKARGIHLETFGVDPRILDRRTHGTYGGYRQHLRRDEEPCEDCARANRDDKNDRMVKKRYESERRAGFPHSFQLF